MKILEKPSLVFAGVGKSFVSMKFDTFKCMLFHMNVMNKMLIEVKGIMRYPSSFGIFIAIVSSSQS